MAGTSKQFFSVSEVLSMLDLDHTQSGSDLDINYLYGESNTDISDLDDSIAMEEPPEEHVHKKRRGHPEPISRECLEIPA